NVGTSPNRRVPIRPFVEESRGSLDRILDFVMGESINNRYALICSNCYTHNGMALREEFKTISYCCYRCNFFNTSKTELNKRSHPLNYSNNNPSTSNKSPPIGALNFTGHTDDSTENEEFEEEFGRKCSLAINGNGFNFNFF
uniref:Endoplasmic reticulum junction formation protein lunapark n=1 Tax=Meloidogyne javanica TaxID=6303 RepID=A0A915MH93_MELJA